MAASDNPENPEMLEKAKPTPDDDAAMMEGYRPTIDDLDALLGKADQMAAEADAEEADATGEMGEGDMAAPESEAAPIMKALGISQERAEDLLAAAKEMDKTKDMDAKTLAKALDEDFQLRMELEKLAAQMKGDDSDEMAEDAMMEEGLMPPTAGPPMGGPPMGGPPMGPGGPMGGM